MPKNSKVVPPSNLKKIQGHPGLYTFVEVSHDARKEKVLLAKIARDASKLREETYVARLLAKPPR